jgi:hypothetical protein
MPAPPVPAEAAEAAFARISGEAWLVAGDVPDSTTLAARCQLLALALEAAAPVLREHWADESEQVRYWKRKAAAAAFVNNAAEERIEGLQAKAEAAVQAGDDLVRAILVAVCERDGLPLESGVVPGEPARNYELALRLGIGRVFGLQVWGM